MRRSPEAYNTAFSQEQSFSFRTVVVNDNPEPVSAFQRPDFHVVPTQEQREAEANDFGAFMQVFVKQRDVDGTPRIACLSYPLGAGIETDHAKDMMSRIVGLESEQVEDTDDYHQSEDGNLLFMANPGARFSPDVLRRFIDIPGEELGVDQTKKKEDLLRNGVLREFYASLNGIRHESAQASQGENIFAFSYRVDEEKGAIYGKNVKGEEGPSLGNLAMEGYDQHKVMLGKLEQKLLEMDEGIVVNFDKSATVIKCCALFFKDKLQGASAGMAEMMQYLGGSRFAAAYVEAETDRNCPGKKKCEKGRCKCSKDEKIAQAA